MISSELVTCRNSSDRWTPTGKADGVPSEGRAERHAAHPKQGILYRISPSLIAAAVLSPQLVEVPACIVYTFLPVPSLRIQVDTVTIAVDWVF